MIETRKQKLEGLVNKRISRIEEIQEEQKEIEERQEIICNYESASSNIKSNIIIMLSFPIPIKILVILLIYGTGIMELAFPLTIIEILFTLSIGSLFLKNILRDKRFVKANKEQYEKAKELSENDQLLKLALSKESKKIDRSLLYLYDLINWIIKQEEQVILEEAVLNVRNQKIEDQEELTRPELDTDQTLEKSYSDFRRK